MDPGSSGDGLVPRSKTRLSALEAHRLINQWVDLDRKSNEDYDTDSSTASEPDLDLDLDSDSEYSEPAKKKQAVSVVGKGKGRGKGCSNRPTARPRSSASSTTSRSSSVPASTGSRSNVDTNDQWREVTDGQTNNAFRFHPKQTPGLSPTSDLNDQSSALDCFSKLIDQNV
ncbi:hypothetical protein PoB_001208000 [Plakobranchus ocellatus]|uniref:Uncharacterized protein n=1 Tax=Plakobranchus ocellatus TaxID=259542 RepID=A0AAV3YS35_9GAST|nr:hypothetical protein PoB_001208000 [Plakobranchus ocellatus]